MSEPYSDANEIVRYGLTKAKYTIVENHIFFKNCRERKINCDLEFANRFEESVGYLKFKQKTETNSWDYDDLKKIIEIYEYLSGRTERLDIIAECCEENLEIGKFGLEDAKETKTLLKECQSTKEKIAAGKESLLLTIENFLSGNMENYRSEKTSCPDREIYTVFMLGKKAIDLGLFKEEEIKRILKIDKDISELVELQTYHEFKGEMYEVLKDYEKAAESYIANLEGQNLENANARYRRREEERIIEDISRTLVMAGQVERARKYVRPRADDHIQNLNEEKDIILKIQKSNELATFLAGCYFIEDAIRCLEFSYKVAVKGGSNNQIERNFVEPYLKYVKEIKEKHPMEAWDRELSIAYDKAGKEQMSCTPCVMGIPVAGMMADLMGVKNPESPVDLKFPKLLFNVVKNTKNQ